MRQLILAKKTKATEVFFLTLEHYSRHELHNFEGGSQLVEYYFSLHL